MIGLGSETLRQAAAIAAQSIEDPWQFASEKAIENSVIINFCHTLPFDGDTAGSGEASGFVVDAENGYIVTNRHVAGPAPFSGSCTFSSQEETVCALEYIDPIHDYAFLSYDPKAIKYLPVHGLLLDPDGSKVGQEIRVVGNDAAQKRSIISGTISQVECNAPPYNEGYRDFNNHYIQANMNVSGGISGSPAFTKNGAAVGMVSGGYTGSESVSSISFLLPLDAVLKTLKCLQEGNPVPRGHMGCRFEMTPFHECKYLGLNDDTEKRYRQISSTSGLLVAKTILSDGPASQKIMVGDILLKVKGRIISNFTPLEDVLDDSVGETIEVLLHREGKVIAVQICVGNLHETTASRISVIAGSVFHNPTLPQAMTFGRPIDGVYVAESNEPFMIGCGSPGWIIKKVGSKTVRDLDDFLQAMDQLRAGQICPITSSHLDDPQDQRTDILTLDISCEMSDFVWDEKTGLWTSCSRFLPSSTDVVEQGLVRLLSKVPKTIALRDPAMAKVSKSLVHVQGRAYFSVDGYSSMVRNGLGVVVDSLVGLVIVSRFVVPHKACHITITLAPSVVVEGRDVFWHPHHHYVIVKYDPAKAIGVVMSAVLSTRAVSWGREASFLGFTTSNGILRHDVRICDVTVTFADEDEAFEDFLCPRNRPMNADLVGVETRCKSGVLVADDGTVLAILLHSVGKLRVTKSCIRTPGLLAVISELRTGPGPNMRMPLAEFGFIPPDVARTLGVPDDLIRKVIMAESQDPRLCWVKDTTCGSQVGLIAGDIIISLEGKICTTLSDLQILYTSAAVTVVLVRDASVMTIELQTSPCQGLETERCLIFCGAWFQPPHLAVRHRLTELPSEVYVSDIVPGSPAQQHSLQSGSFITKANGQDVYDIDSFIKIISSKLYDSSEARWTTLVAITASGTEVKCVLRPNYRYFPTYEWRNNSNEGQFWERRCHNDEMMQLLPTISRKEEDLVG